MLVLLQFPESLSTAKIVENQQFGFFLAPAPSPHQHRTGTVGQSIPKPSPVYTGTSFFIWKTEQNKTPQNKAAALRALSSVLASSKWLKRAL